MAVLLPGKFIFLAQPHTGSSAMGLALQDVFPEALDLRPHHMTLADVKGEPGAVRMEQISRARTRIWKKDRLPGDWDPEIVRKFVTGKEQVFCVLRNPYDFLVSCYVRRGGNQPFEAFVRSYSQSPYIENGRIYYHQDDCHTLLRHETLQLDLNTFMSSIGEPDVPLERHNETKYKKPWDIYYTPEAFKIVNDRFGAEFSKFYTPRAR